MVVLWFGHPSRYAAQATIRHHNFNDSPDTADAGIRYAVVVPKHHDGFAMWDTAVDPGIPDWTIMKTPWHRDYVKEMADACAGSKVQFCLYYSVLDWVNPHYGGIFYHSDARRDLRWAGSESGTTGYPCSSNLDLTKLRTQNGAPAQYLASGEADGPDFCPALADIPLRGKGGHEWFWEPGDEKLILPLNDLVGMYEKSVGRNATLVIGLTPDPRGLLPAADVARAKEFGAAIRARYGNPLASIAGEGDELVLRLPAGARVDRVRFGEQTRAGERVRGYVLEAQTDAGWTLVAQGTTVGHTRIEKFPALTTGALRLRITQNTGRVRMREFSAFAAR